MIISCSVIASLIASVAIIYWLTPLGAQQIVLGNQLVPYNTKWYTEHAEKIVIGRAVMVTNKVIDESFTSTNTETGEPIYNELKTPVYEIIIEAEKYLKDGSGKYPSQLTAWDRSVNGLFIGEGVKLLVVSEDGGSQYKTGERALFFLFNVKGNLQFNGVASKFSIDDNSLMVQSKHEEELGNEPRELSRFESEIKNAVTTPVNSQ